jgi:general secretion pathway protein I
MTKRGFTLLEVMLALALLGLALTVLIKSAAGSIFGAEESHMMGVATDLARSKMYDIEEKLLKEGFSDTDQSQTDFKAFEEEGWPNVFYKYDVIQVQFPNWDELQAMAQGKAKAMGSGSGAAAYVPPPAAGSALGSGSGLSLGSNANDPLSSFQNSALGGMMGMMGMLGGGTGAGASVAGAQGASLIQSKFDMFQQILKVTVRKVKLTVKWQVLGRDRDMVVIAFYTDPAAMDKVLSGMGSVDISGAGTGSGAGAGSSSSGNRNRGSGAGSGK